MVWSLNPTFLHEKAPILALSSPTSIRIARQTPAKGEEPQQGGAEGASFGGQGGRVTGLGSWTLMDIIIIYIYIYIIYYI